MVRPELRELARTFEQLQGHHVRVRNYTGAAQDAAFDITTADTFVAGIATQLLDEQTVPHEHRSVVAHPSLREGRYWTLTDGGSLDLAPYPELLAYALAVEAVREQCQRLLGG
jgi:hypothetical protein